MSEQETEKRGRGRPKAPEFVMPSTETDLKAIQGAVEEVVSSMVRIAAEGDLKKAIASRMKEEYGMPAKKLNALARIHYNRNLAEVEAEGEDTVELYRKVMKPKED